MATMKLSISTNDRRCPPDQPVALVNDDTGDLVGCYRSTAAALRQKDILEAGPNPVLAYPSKTVIW